MERERWREGVGDTGIEREMEWEKEMQRGRGRESYKSLWDD